MFQGRNVTTGVSLLSFPEGDYSHGLVFSPDDRRLAIGTMPVWGSGSVSLLELDYSRGIQTYRGLTGQVCKVCFSLDGRRLAALSHDWQAAVWDRDSGRLVAVINVPPASFVDNASLALSPDCQRLAYAGGHEARLWNLETGEERGWSFRDGEADHEGLQDQLAFTGPDRLLSARVENRDGRGFPAGLMSPDQPKVVRVRNLLGSEPIKPITEIADLELAVHANQLTFDGRYLVAGGFTGSPSHPRHLLNGYEVSMGKRLWSAPVSAEPNQLYVRLDPTSSTLLWWVGDRGFTLLDIADGRYLGTIERRGYPSLGPRASLIMGFDSGTDDEPSGLELRRRDNDGERGLFRLTQDSSFQAGALDARSFTSDGRYAALGSTDGSVFVFDFEAINRRLSGIGMGW